MSHKRYVCSAMRNGSQPQTNRWQYFGSCLDAEIPGTPGRFYFSKDTGVVRTHQVHACAVRHSEVTDKLAFRDYLRSHPRRAAAYGQLKQHLALVYHQDNIGYMRGKDAFVKTVLGEARR